MEKMVKCKACEKEIAKSAKVCPHCGKKIKKKGWMIAVVLIGIGLIWAISDGASGSSKGNAASTPTASKNESIKDVPVATRIGDAFSTKKLEITINEAKKLAKVGDEYFSSTPAEGGIYVAVRYKYKNIGTEPIGVFDKPSLKLISPDGVEYSADTGASMYYATEVKIDEKALSDLNPGITVNSAEVFEIAKDKITVEGWKMKIEGKEIVLTF